MYLESMKQTVAAVFTLESERVGLSKACLIILHPRHLLNTRNRERSKATIVSEHNLGAVATNRTNEITMRTTHIGVKLHHVRSLVADNVRRGWYLHLDGLPKIQHSHEELGCAKIYFRPPHPVW